MNRKQHYEIRITDHSNQSRFDDVKIIFQGFGGIMLNKVYK